MDALLENMPTLATTVTGSNVLHCADLKEAAACHETVFLIFYYDEYRVCHGMTACAETPCGMWTAVWPTCRGLVGRGQQLHAGMRRGHVLTHSSGTQAMP